MSVHQLTYDLELTIDSSHLAKVKAGEHDDPFRRHYPQGSCEEYGQGLFPIFPIKLNLGNDVMVTLKPLLLGSLLKDDWRIRLWQNCYEHEGSASNARGNEQGPFPTEHGPCVSCREWCQLRDDARGTQKQGVCPASRMRVVEYIGIETACHCDGTRRCKASNKSKAQIGRPIGGPGTGKGEDGETSERPNQGKLASVCLAQRAPGQGACHKANLIESHGKYELNIVEDLEMSCNLVDLATGQGTAKDAIEDA